ncbi:acyloxyacyl hydrolase [Acidicapsa dinghuensis]|uniref:Acyloxyacyl hydrolase n=1 Tax=Acidicapsa dinghuensis TaxID=2218256 RepID=A0ABW1ENA2_9BACT
MRTFLLIIALIGMCAFAFAQATPPITRDFSRKNTFGFSVAYSNDSSPMILGVAENRKLLNFGVSYARRLWQGSFVNWQYSAEATPIALESDPVIHEVITFTSPNNGISTQNFEPVNACKPGSGTYSQTTGGITYSYSYVDTCTRQWTVGEGLSPIGFQWNFFPSRKLQPVVMAHGGYLYTTRPIPDTSAGSFNFTFDFGAGVEFWHSAHHSIRADYRYHHISNAYTASDNPGIDSGLFQITYAFGK